MESQHGSEIGDQPTLTTGQKVFLLEKDALSRIKALHKSGKITLEQHQHILEEVIEILTPHATETAAELFQIPKAVYLPDNIDKKLEPALAFCTPLRLGRVIADKVILRNSALAQITPDSVLKTPLFQASQTAMPTPVVAHTYSQNMRNSSRTATISISANTDCSIPKPSRRVEPQTTPTKQAVRNNSPANRNGKDVKNIPTKGTSRSKVAVTNPVLATETRPIQKRIKVATGARPGKTTVRKKESTPVTPMSTTERASIATRRIDEALRQALAKRPATSPARSEGNEKEGTSKRLKRMNKHQ